MRLQDKTAVVTGGARGIGRAAVELFASEGATVYALDVDITDTPELERVTWVSHDVTDEQAWTRLVDRVVSETTRIDVLLNNAGTVGS